MYISCLKYFTVCNFKGTQPPPPPPPPPGCRIQSSTHGTYYFKEKEATNAYYSVGDKLVFRCNTGFSMKLKGRKKQRINLKCTGDGSWNKDLPVCQPDGKCNS